MFAVDPLTPRPTSASGGLGDTSLPHSSTVAHRFRQDSLDADGIMREVRPRYTYVTAMTRVAVLLLRAGMVVLVVPLSLLGRVSLWVFYGCDVTAIPSLFFHHVS